MPQPARTRTPEEIRDSIEQNRQELVVSIDKLRAEVVSLTDWRSQIASHQQQVTIGAGVAGFVLGGGIAALGSLVFGRRRGGSAARCARSSRTVNPRGQTARRSCSHERAGQRPGAEQSRPDVGADHRADLGHHDRVAAEDLTTPGDQLGRLARGLNVLHHPGVGAVVAT